MDKIPPFAEEIKNLKSTHKKFISVYENFVSKKECKQFIKIFNKSRTYNRQESEGISPMLKKDDAFSYSSNIDRLTKSDHELFKNFHHRLDYLLHQEYPKIYPGINHIPLYLEGIKIQKTTPGGGYHVWHSELSPHNPSRAVVFTVYLNNIKEGGETEFLDHHMRVSPKKGLLCLFPASYTHLHRGNPPLDKIKYIITGWFNVNLPTKESIETEIKRLELRLKNKQYQQQPNGRFSK